MSAMNVLIISDGHGSLDMLDAMAPVIEGVDMVLYGGDFAAFNKPETGLPFLERLAKLHDQVFSVTGNCDAPDFLETMETYDISVEASLSYFGGLVLTGSGGGLNFTGETSNERSDEDLAGDLRLAELSVEENAEEGSTSSENTSGWNNLIVIAHNPPKDTACDVASGGVHVGSPLIRTFIERTQPLLVVCGHIHESFATDTMGQTLLVNPGALVEGRYALAEISGGSGKRFEVTKLELLKLPL